jgi:hypothetical protein
MTLTRLRRIIQARNRISRYLSEATGLPEEQLGYRKAIPLLGQDVPYDLETVRQVLRKVENISGVGDEYRISTLSDEELKRHYKTARTAAIGIVGAVDETEFSDYVTDEEDSRESNGLALQ